MLLTSGQISMGISSFVGYVLQQQTVRNIQAVIRPPPARPQSAIASARPALVDLRPDDAPPPKVQWDRLAYVQLTTSPSSICEALVVFSELRRQGSRADQILLYPRAWDKGQGGGVTAMQLLELAIDKYNVKAWPIDPLMKESDPLESNSYPLTTLLALTHYNALLTLTTPSLMLHRESLDSLLSEAPDSPVSFLPIDGSISSDLLLLRPSLAAYSRAAAGLASSSSTPELRMLRNLYPTEESILSPSTFGESIVFGSSRLGLTEQDEMDILQSVSLMVFDDRNIPGPATDAPSSAWLSSRPAGGAGAVWEGLRERYQAEWQGVCGLELEAWNDTNHDDVSSEL